MSMRITGLATGLDVDQIIKDTMKPHRIKIQQVQQNKEILEIRQKLYREVIKESREFYNKYLDITKSDSILLSRNWSSVKFTSSKDSVVTAKGLGGAVAENYTIDVERLATTAKTTLSQDIYQNEENKVIQVKISSETINISLDGLDRNNNTTITNAINTELAGKGIKARYSTISQGIIFESVAMGENQKFEVFYGENGTENTLGEVSGTDILAKITNSAGNEYPVYGSSNRVVVDGVEFTFNGLTVDEFGGSTGSAKLTSSIDATDIKDKLVNFINDYNTLMEKLNTLTSEKRNRNFMPLTDDQKSEMSETEITLWNAKVQQGQLRRDSDLMRIANSMNESTKSVFSGSVAFLEQIGINPVADYAGTKNGTFTIDEDKLTAALENSAEDVMKLFTSTSTATASTEKYANTGIAQRIKTILYNETVTSQALLLQKAGMEGSSTSITNELTKSIEKFERRMSDMETAFSKREQLLYTKYANLETMMNKLNSQQSYLLSQLGMN